MKSYLKNYTSEVPAANSLASIEALLVRFGATRIARQYRAQTIVAMQFELPLESKPVMVKLPANVEIVLETLWTNYVAGLRGSAKREKEDFRPQAERTAWKLVRDWVEVQLSMAQTSQAAPLGIFLPYVWDGRRTFYEHVVERGFKGMLAEKSEGG